MEDKKQEYFAFGSPNQPWQRKNNNMMKKLKKETVLEAAEKRYGNWHGAVDRINAFIEGAKWQDEQDSNWLNDLKLMEIELRNTKTLLASCEKALEDRDKQAESQALKLYTEDDLRKAYNAGEQSRYSRKGEALLKQEYFDALKNK